MNTIKIRENISLLITYRYHQIKSFVNSAQGLEYHYNNFLSHLKELAIKKTLEDDTMLDHEVTAYLNRLGQLSFFLVSQKLMQYCPKIKELLLFRNKNTAHRSIDTPRKEDTLHEQIWQSGALMRRIFSGKVNPGNPLEEEMLEFLTPQRYNSNKAFISYQIISGKIHADFTPQKDHPIIIKEINEVYKRLFH
ncbi:MAG TPA: hypothetical protein ENH96_03515 [Chlamydiae bacterium]|nr:hypothetical protein [Chlamydiota bacterium]